MKNIKSPNRKLRRAYHESRRTLAFTACDTRGVLEGLTLPSSGPPLACARGDKYNERGFGNLGDLTVSARAPSGLDATSDHFRLLPCPVEKGLGVGKNQPPIRVVSGQILSGIFLKREILHRRVDEELKLPNKEMQLCVGE
ncbi:hypothetical protein OOU_Y34scaffold00301g4 [Pyricularia oryzae Y34]|uniref:Uncharacterized protein n=1 Tax=Pyricularia oryzae (strain Y34) TaxID=1143189 RepID=A0AA97P351_PYRO3|nr:hypothetical protein OOU_Y34scaffold00301g4 [Pyricularia oryzae Y34]